MRQTSSLELTVVKPHWLKRGLLLFDGELQVGRIDYTKTFSLDGNATILNEQWNVSQPGFWKTAFEFTATGKPLAKVEIHPSFSGKVEWKNSDGNQYVFRKTRWWKNTWAWFDRKENPVIEIRPDYSFTNKQATIFIHNKDLAGYRLMVLIGIFIFNLQKSRASAAAS